MSFRICTIGCGGMAQAGHGPSYQKYVAEHAGVELAACCDINAERAEEFRQRFGFAKSYTDFREMLRAEKPDAVCLLVNVEYLCPLSIEIFELGIPLLLEKPPGLDVAETTRMAEAAARRGVPHAVAFNRRSTPIINIMRDEVAAIEASGLKTQRYHYELLRYKRPDPDFSTTAIHGIDALRHIARADYKTIHFFYQELPELGAGVCNISMECTLTSGAAASLLFAPVNGKLSETGRALAYNHCVEVSMPTPEPSDSLMRHYDCKKIVREVCGETLPGGGESYITSGFYGENCSFFDDIQAGRTPVNLLPTALQSVAVAECLRKRAATYGL